MFKWELLLRPPQVAPSFPAEDGSTCAQDILTSKQRADVKRGHPSLFMSAVQTWGGAVS